LTLLLSPYGKPVTQIHTTMDIGRSFTE
jgi:hypothetical protein